MAVAPVPVFALFLLFGLGVFMVFPVIFGQEAAPRGILVIIPVVIVLVFGIVDTDLDSLWAGRRDHGNRSDQGRSEKNCSDITMWDMHSNPPDFRRTGIQILSHRGIRVFGSDLSFRRVAATKMVKSGLIQTTGYIWLTRICCSR